MPLKSKLSTILKIAAATVVVLALVVIFFPWNWLRGPIERYVTDKTGRALVISGDLDVKLRRRPVVSVEKLSFANPPWAQHKQLIAADRIEFTLDVPALLQRRVVFHSMRLTAPAVAMEKSADGSRSWVLDKSDDKKSAPPEIRLLQVERGRLDYRDDPAKLSFTAEVDIAANRPELKSPQPDRLPTHIAVKGRYGEGVFSGDAWAGSVLSIQNTDEPFPLVVTVRTGDTRLDADGTITNLLKLSRIDTRLRIAGPDMAKLFPLIPLPLPSSPPYVFDGRFRRAGNVFTYDGFKGKVGNSDLSGDATYELREPRPFLKAALVSKVLDLKDLGPLVGLKPSQQKKEKPVAIARSGRKAAPATPRRVLPHDPFKFNRLQAMDADVTLTAGQIKRPDALALENLKTHLVLNEGVLKLDPLNFGFAGGDIVSTVQIDSHVQPFAARAHLDFRRLKLAKLFPTVELMKDSEGSLGAQMRLAGRGNSVAEMLASSGGNAALAMSGGELSNMLMEAVGLDVGELLKFLIAGDRKTPVRCAVAAFKVTEGVARTDTFVFDTVDTVIRGQGHIDLRDESFDLMLRPYPKDVSLPVVRVPVRVYGAFNAPRYAPDKGALFMRGGAALALGLVNPLAALIPLVETGPGKDSDCNALLAPVGGALKQADPARPKPKAVPAGK
jgi:uncharacterized protein involved in outer membrane biogenesis